MATSNNTKEEITIDLRNRKGKSNHFGINDIHFSPLQNDPSFNVPIMILIEKQPRYPIYYGNIGNALVNLTTGLKNFLSSILSKSGKASLGGSVLSELASQGGEIAAKMLGNKRIEQISKNPSEYYSNVDQYMNNIKNLFTTVNGSKICSYELPFLSEYFLEADGDAGWQATGMDAQFGDLAKTMTNYNIGFPITPNWTYDSKRLSTEFTFNLINDTSDNLKDNLEFIHAILPGMMHVLVNGSEMGKESSLQQMGSNILGAVTTLFKSPNVYEVIVPGRFRWLWCTAQMNIKYKGKIYNEDMSNLIGGASEKNKSGYEYLNIEPGLIAFPEAYEVEMTINSLLPQSFNEFYYGITNNGVSFTRTETRTATEKAIEQSTDPLSQYYKGFNNNIDSSLEAVEKRMKEIGADYLLTNRPKDNSRQVLDQMTSKTVVDQITNKIYNPSSAVNQYFGPINSTKR